MARRRSSVWPWVIGIGLVVLLAGAGGTTRSHRKLSRRELEELARKVGFPKHAARRAAEIAMRESGGDPNVINDTRGQAQNLPPGTTVEKSVGLWQINMLAWPRFSEDELLDPDGNARAALSIWKLHGWRPWSTARKDEPPPDDDDDEPPIVTPGPPVD